MHWTYPDVLALPPEIYSELVVWLNATEPVDAE